MDSEFRQHEVRIVAVAHCALEANGQDGMSNVVASLSGGIIN